MSRRRGRERRRPRVRGRRQRRAATHALRSVPRLQLTPCGVSLGKLRRRCVRVRVTGAAHLHGVAVRIFTLQIQKPGCVVDQLQDVRKARLRRLRRHLRKARLRRHLRNARLRRLLRGGLALEGRGRGRGRGRRRGRGGLAREGPVVLVVLKSQTKSSPQTEVVDALEVAVVVLEVLAGRARVRILKLKSRGWTLGVRTQASPPPNPPTPSPSANRPSAIKTAREICLKYWRLHPPKKTNFTFCFQRSRPLTKYSMSDQPHDPLTSMTTTASAIGSLWQPCKCCPPCCERATPATPLEPKGYGAINMFKKNQNA